METGLYYVNARYYNSTTGRFITEDTYIGKYYDPLSLNRYTYCHNNPLRYTDPSGHGLFSFLAKGVIGALVGGGIEYVKQRFVEKRKEIDWKAVAYEAVVGGVGALLGGSSNIKSLAKSAVKSGVSEAAQGFVTDLGQQVIVEEKKASEIDVGQAVKTMAIAGIGGILGAVTDYAADWFRNARTKYVPMEVEVEKVRYECFNHVINCKNHENDIRVVTKEKEWRMVGIPEFGGSDKTLMDYMEERAKEQIAKNTASQNAVSALEDGAAEIVTKKDSLLDRVKKWWNEEISDGDNSEVRYRIGQPVKPMKKTYDMALNPELYANEVAKKYGINLRGSGQEITIKFNPEISRGRTGRVEKTSPNVIQIGPDALISEEELANTIAHELNHARDFLRGGEAIEPPAYDAGNALADFIRGGR